MKEVEKYEDIALPEDIPDNLFELVSEIIDFIEKADSDKADSKE